MLKDVLGRIVQVNDVLAISPSRQRRLFLATVVKIEERWVQGWVWHPELENGRIEDVRKDTLHLRLRSNGRIIKETAWDLAGAVVILPGEGE